MVDRQRCYSWSSNASANGLGFEGNEARNLVEANLLIDDQEILDAIEKWFDKLKSTPISATDYRLAEKLWHAHRQNRPALTKTTVLEAIRENSDNFRDRNFFVWIYDIGELEPETKNKVEIEQEARKIADLCCWEDVELPPGSYVLEYDVKHGRVSYNGFFKVLMDNHVIKEKEGKVLLCRPVTKFEELKLGSQKIWTSAAQAAWDRRGKVKEIGYDVHKFSEYLKQA